jgi:hypothetical protein
VGKYLRTYDKGTKEISRDPMEECIPLLGNYRKSDVIWFDRKDVAHHCKMVRNTFYHFMEQSIGHSSEDKNTR